MKVVAVGSDHRGFAIKSRIAELLSARGLAVVDYGATSSQSVDYTDIAREVALAVAAGEVDRGVLVCGTGLGMAMVANRVPGVRATPVHDEVTAELSRSHTDSNVICLSADLMSERLINVVLSIWLDMKFEGGRHERRLGKLRNFERELRRAFRADRPLPAISPKSETETLLMAASPVERVYVEQ